MMAIRRVVLARTWRWRYRTPMKVAAGQGDASHCDTCGQQKKHQASFPDRRGENCARYFTQPSRWFVLV